MIALLLSDEELPDKFALNLVRVLKSSVVKASGGSLVPEDPASLSAPKPAAPKKELTKQQKASRPQEEGREGISPCTGNFVFFVFRVRPKVIRLHVMTRARFPGTHRARWTPAIRTPWGVTDEGSEGRLGAVHFGCYLHPVS